MMTVKMMLMMTVKIMLMMRSRLTLHTAAALFESVDVGVNTAVTV